jgi:hypothetical protein
MKLIPVLILILLPGLVTLGWTTFFSKDISGLSLLILLIFAMTQLSILTGFHQKNETRWRMMLRMPGVLSDLGILGTVVGIGYAATRAFSLFESSSNLQDTAVQALSHFGSGLGIAITTTVVGISTGMILRLQLVPEEEDD